MWWVGHSQSLGCPSTSPQHVAFAKGNGGRGSVVRNYNPKTLGSILPGGSGSVFRRGRLSRRLFSPRHWSSRDEFCLAITLQKGQALLEATVFCSTSIQTKTSEFKKIANQNTQVVKNGRFWIFLILFRVLYVCLTVCRFVKGNVCRTFAHCFIQSVLKRVHF